MIATLKICIISWGRFCDHQDDGYAALCPSDLHISMNQTESKTTILHITFT